MKIVYHIVCKEGSLLEADRLTACAEASGRGRGYRIDGYIDGSQSLSSWIQEEAEKGVRMMREGAND